MSDAAAAAEDDAPEPVVVAVLFGSTFCLIGLASLGYFAVGMYEQYEVRHWVPAEARIESIELGRRGRSLRTVVATIRYRYEYDGQSYVGTKGDTMLTRQLDRRAYLYREKTERGKAITCYVDPDDPTRAVIETSLTASSFAWLVGLPFVAFGGFIVAAALRSGAGSRAAE